MRTTVRISDDALAAHVDARDASSDAEAMRECIRRSRELEECRERVARLEQEVDRLQSEKRLILEEREEHSQLVAAVEQEQTLAEERAAASAVTRAKWWLFGRDRGD